MNEEIIRPKEGPLRTLSKFFKRKRDRIKKLLNSNIYGYILLVLMTLLLVIVQIILIDIDNKSFTDFKKLTKNNSILVKSLCDKFENSFFFEELFYLPFSCLFFGFLIVKQNRRRFGYYITQKFKKDSDILQLKKSYTCNQKDNKTLIPSFSFSTVNRIESIAIYVIYTYDVLNIFLFIYTSNYNVSLIPYYERYSGVIFDFLIQIIQVLLIGVKFYPILIVADLDPSISLYFITTCYILMIWTVRFINKAFCSQAKAIIQQSFKSLINDLNKKIESNLESKYKISNAISGLFNDHTNYNEIYLNAIKNIIPSMFKKVFSNNDEIENERFYAGTSTKNTYNFMFLHL